MRRMKATVPSIVVVGFCALIATQAGTAFAAPMVAGAESRPGDKAVEIVKQPLADLDIMQKDTATVLVRAKAAPYARPAARDCRALDAEIQELDIVLGPDIDFATTGKSSLSKKMSDQTFNLARGAVSSVIPYRGVVRQITGAEKRARNLNEAMVAGMVRRAYLKGYGETMGCEFRAPPRSAEEVRAVQPTKG